MALHPPQPSIAIQPYRQVHPIASRRRRNTEATAFVAVWMVAGYLLPIDSNGYLLLGVPLTAIFQVVVRRRPLRELYSGDPTRATVDRSGVVMAGVLTLVPGWYAVKVLATGDWTLLGWYLAALAGAACAAFALRATSVPEALRSAALPLAVGSSAFVLAYGLAHVATQAPVPVAAGLVALAKYSALYFPASFLLEEVAFRGALDAHVHHDGERGGRLSAIYVSVLWGVWHLPVSTGLPLPLLLVELVVVHVLLGVPLSIAWRRSRNLTGPALAHAVNDAVRNALMLGL
jgi:membrane protease YdiL (CAAX protease family)